MRRVFSVVVVVLSASACFGAFFLPGMQPKEAGIEFAKVDQCRMCHSGTDNGMADPFMAWQGSMMSEAARDPVVRAAIAVANQDYPGIGEFCFRCHAPRGWLEDRSKPADGSALNNEDLYGVSCDVCHRLMDPLSREAKDLVKDPPPSYGNAMMVADPANKVRGPYGDAAGAMPHRTAKSAYHATSSLCATCHDISNPTMATDVNTAPVYTFGHLERTYSEWLLSDYAKKGADGTCQSCHYKKVKGGGQASRYGSRHRDYFVTHGPVGGSTWVQDVTRQLWNGKNMDPTAMAIGKARAKEMLQAAASLELKIVGSGKAYIRVTNLTGHKLPTGYVEGRRAWLNVQFLDSAGKVISEIGKFGEKIETIAGEQMKVNALLDEDKARVYEALPGMSEKVAAKHGQKAGKSFHFILNDIMVKDTRIPPEGFKNAAYAERLSKPVGIDYADGQNWDQVEYDVPAGTAKVAVKLMYQSVVAEYIKFLAEEDKTDDWGKRLYKAWLDTGQCPPEVMAQAEMAVPGK